MKRILKYLSAIKNRRARRKEQTKGEISNRLQSMQDRRADKTMTRKEWILLKKKNIGLE
jgi:hypothetical protein